MSNNESWLALSVPVNSTPAAITPDNRGMAYGDGFFTTMAVLNGVVLWLEHHRQRLVSHAQALQLDIDSDYLVSAIQVQAEQLEQGVIKVIFIRAQQSVRGYSFTADRTGRACEVWLKATAMTIETPQQLQLPNNRHVFIQPVISATCLSSQLACLPPSLAGLKTLNRLDSVLASGELEALKANSKINSLDNEGLGEGLLRDMTGDWVEGTMSNVFYQLDEKQINDKDNNSDHAKNSNDLTKGQWYTPSMSQSGVAGVMRQVIIESLSTTDKPVIVRSLTDGNLPHLSRLFFCNAVRGIMPVSALTLLEGEVVELSL